MLVLWMMVILQLEVCTYEGGGGGGGGPATYITKLLLLNLSTVYTTRILTVTLVCTLAISFCA